MTIQEVRSGVPTSDVVDSFQAIVSSWLQDNNFFVNRFRPVTTDRLRLVLRKTSFGMIPDETARKAIKHPFVSEMVLREIEIYGPPPAAEVRLTVDPKQQDEFGQVVCKAAFDRFDVGLTLANAAAAPSAAPPG